MLHNNHRIAGVAEGFEGMNEFVIITLMETNARLIKDIQHIHQLAANLRGKPNALRLAARKSLRRTVKAQVVETNIVHKAHAGLDFFQNFGRYSALTVSEFRVYFVEECAQVGNVHRGEVGDIFISNTKTQRLTVKAVALAIGTSTFGGVFLHNIVVLIIVGSILDILDNAVIRGRARTIHPHPIKMKRFGRAIEHNVLSLRRQHLKRRIKAKTFPLRQRLQLSEHKIVLVFAQRLYRALLDGEFWIWDYLCNINPIYHAQPLARWAETSRRIVRKICRGGIFVRNARCGTHQEFGIMTRLACLRIKEHNHIFAECEGGFHRFAHPLHTAALLRAVGRHNYFVNNNLNIVHLVAVGLHIDDDVFDVAVNTHLQVSFTADLLKEFAVMTFSATDCGCKHHNFFTAVLFDDEFADLVFGISHHLLAGLVTKRLSRPRIPNSQKIIYFRNCTHSGAGVAVGAFLLDADDRAETRNLVNVRAFHIAHKLTCVSVEGLHITPPALGKYCVEGK